MLCIRFDMNFDKTTIFRNTVLSSKLSKQANLIDLGIAHQLLHRVFRVESVPAEDLHGIRGILVGHVAGVSLGDRCHVGVSHSLKQTMRKNVFRLRVLTHTVVHSFRHLSYLAIPQGLTIISHAN